MGEEYRCFVFAFDREGSEDGPRRPLPPEERNFLDAVPEGLTLRFWAHLYRLTRVPTFVPTEGVVGGAGRLRPPVDQARMATGLHVCSARLLRG
jgi:hypothetical protein